MKPAPICEVIRRIRPLAIKRKQAHVAALIVIEKREHGRTKRLTELEALAFSICFPQVKKEIHAS
jgi:hypothetical protein